MKKYPNINARAILKRHNRWRRGAEIPQEDPKTIGDAIDLIVLEHAEMEKALKKIWVPDSGAGSLDMQKIAFSCLDKIKHRKGIK